MPEVYFTIRLPSGETRECYSPSSVIRNYFGEGEEMPAKDFLRRSREALTEVRIPLRIGGRAIGEHRDLDEIVPRRGRCPHFKHLKKEVA
jgi:uncharacterized repeat protein (TIGR04042 family)